MADTVNFKSAIFLLGSITILYHTIRNVLYHILPYRCQINQRSAQTIVAESKLSFIQPYSVALALVIWLYMCYKVQCQAIMYYKSQTACCDQNELTSSLTRCCFSFFSDTILSFFSGFGFFNLYFIQRSESLSVQEKKRKNEAQWCRVQERKKFKWWRFSHRYNTIWKELLSNDLHFTVKVRP